MVDRTFGAVHETDTISQIRMYRENSMLDADLRFIAPTPARSSSNLCARRLAK
jgi:hypothetical protein